MKLLGAVLAAALGPLAAAPPAAVPDLFVSVQAGDSAIADAPVECVVPLPEDAVNSRIRLVGVGQGEESPLAAQVVGRSGAGARLAWVVPAMPGGGRREWLVRVEPGKKSRGRFVWKDSPGKHLDLVFDGRRVSRYLYGRDASSPERAHETMKPYTHIFGERGKRSITKGPYGLYSHHRGIFFGWNKVGYKGRLYDLWHLRDGEVQLHREFADLSAGPVAARAVARIEWRTADDGETILAESRSATFHRQLGADLALVDYVIEVVAPMAAVELDGDPEHAGFQFRAANAISGKDDREGTRDVPLGKNRQAEYLFHADGVDPKRDRDLPWVALSYVLDGRPYCVVHMSHPDNPKGAAYSAYRDYGRFGAWTRLSLKRGEGATFRYRILVRASAALSRDECAARYAAWVEPPVTGFRR